MPDQSFTLPGDAYGIQVTGTYSYSFDGDITTKFVNISLQLAAYSKTAYKITKYERDDSSYDGTNISVGVKPDGFWYVNAQIYLNTSDVKKTSVEMKPNMTGSISLLSVDGGLSEGFEVKIITGPTLTELAFGSRLPIIPGESNVVYPTTPPLRVP